MTSHFYTASIYNNKNEIVLLPLTGIDGSRLNWHRSDRVYFGNSLRWRRSKNYKTILPATKNDYKGYCEVLKWAKNKEFHYSNGIYLKFFQAQWPSIQGYKVEFFKPNVIGEIKLSPEKCKVS